MQLISVLFEDQSAFRFRPLSWSLPVYELRCGIFNARERLTRVLADLQPGKESPCPFFLTREYLRELGSLDDQRGLELLDDTAVGPLGSDDQGRILLINGRIGPRWDLLACLAAAGARGEDLACFDESGLLACSLDTVMFRRLLASWRRWDAACSRQRSWAADGEVTAWENQDFFSEWPASESVGSVVLRRPAGVPDIALDPIGATLLDAGETTLPLAFEYIWDLVPAVGPALQADAARTVFVGATLDRRLFGITADAEVWGEIPPWRRGTAFCRLQDTGLDTSQTGLVSADAVWLGEDVQIDPFVHLDASRGPIILDRGVRVMSASRLEGPLYVGAGSVIKAGACIYGESSLGAVCKIAGEVGESTFLDFGNKQHDGFVGHAVLGSWINLGAMTTNSDLKNNYGPVRVDLGFGARDTGEQFMGLLMGEHSRCAIGTLFNTGTCVGFSANIFASGFPDKYLPNFTWGGLGDGPLYDVKKARATAAKVFSRRGCIFSEAHEQLFSFLASARD